MPLFHGLDLFWTRVASCWLVLESCWFVLTLVDSCWLVSDSCWPVFIRVDSCRYSCIRIDLIDFFCLIVRWIMSKYHMLRNCCQDLLPMLGKHEQIDWLWFCLEFSANLDLPMIFRRNISWLNCSVLVGCRREFWWHSLNDYRRF